MSFKKILFTVEISQSKGSSLHNLDKIKEDISKIFKEGDEAYDVLDVIIEFANNVPHSAPTAANAPNRSKTPTPRIRARTRKTNTKPQLVGMSE